MHTIKLSDEQLKFLYSELVECLDSYDQIDVPFLKNQVGNLLADIERQTGVEYDAEGTNSTLLQRTSEDKAEPPDYEA